MLNKQVLTIWEVKYEAISSDDTTAEYLESAAIL